MMELKTAAQANRQAKRRAGCAHKHLTKYEYVGANLRVSERTECLDCGYHVDKTQPHQP